MKLDVALARRDCTVFLEADSTQVIRYLASTRPSNLCIILYKVLEGHCQSVKFTP